MVISCIVVKQEKEKDVKIFQEDCAMFSTFQVS